jgi:predicted secreted protein
MSISLAVAIYFLVWWITLFAVLPWGVRAQGEEGAPGTDPGAPQLPRLLSKLIWTTVVASAVFGVAMFLYLNKYVTLDDLARLMGTPD